MSMGDPIADYIVTASRVIWGEGEKRAFFESYRFEEERPPELILD